MSEEGNKISEKETTSFVSRMATRGAHVGYKRSRRHPSISAFLYGKRDTRDVFDLAETHKQVTRACEFVTGLAKDGKVLLFLGTKPEAQVSIHEHATRIGMPYVTRRWVGGFLTNFNEVKKRIGRLREIKEWGRNGELEKYTKKEQGRFVKEQDKLEQKFGGVAALDFVPGALFIVDSKHEETALREANQLGIPVVALANSDCDITLIDYPIVANDASRASIEFFVESIADAYGVTHAQENKEGEE